MSIKGFNKSVDTLTFYKKPFKVLIGCLNNLICEAVYDSQYKNLDLVIYEHQNLGLMAGIIVGYARSGYHIKRIISKSDRIQKNIHIHVKLDKIRCRLETMQ